VDYDGYKYKYRIKIVELIEHKTNLSRTENPIFTIATNIKKKFRVRAKVMVGRASGKKQLITYVYLCCEIHWDLVK